MSEHADEAAARLNRWTQAVSNYYAKDAIDQADTDIIVAGFNILLGELGRRHTEARSLIAAYMRAEGATEGEIAAKLHSLFDRIASPSEVRS